MDALSMDPVMLSIIGKALLFIVIVIVVIVVLIIAVLRWLLHLL